MKCFDCNTQNEMQFIESNAYNEMFCMKQVNSYRSLSQSCDFYNSHWVFIYFNKIKEIVKICSRYGRKATSPEKNPYKIFSFKDNLSNMQAFGSDSLRRF